MRVLTRTSRILSAALAVALLGACGGDDDSADTTAAPSSTAAPTTAAPTTLPADTTAADTTAADTTTADTTATGTGNAVGIDLAEWTLTPAGEIIAGTNDFTVTNSGEFPHQFMIIKGDGYTTLPLTTSGAVDEAALAPDALLGSTDRITPGATATISFDLEPGNYVLLCNIAVGPNSHAAAGQTLDITVS